MTFAQLMTDIGAGIAALAAIATILAHLPFMPAKYAEFFARIALYASNAKFSVNQRDTMPPKGDTSVSGGGSGSITGAAALLLAICFGFHATACSIFGSGGSFWPKVTSCAPSPASLVSQVADILLAGGDYEQALEQKALLDGAAAVECAVKAAVDQLAAKVGATLENTSAIARGKTFLAKHPVAQ